MNTVRSIKRLVTIFLLSSFFSLPVYACDSTDLNSPVGHTGQSSAMIEDAKIDMKGIQKIPYYDIDLYIEEEGSTFTGKSKVTYTNLENILQNNLYFRLFPNAGRAYGNGSLIVNSVMSGAKPLKIKRSLQGSVLEVVLTEAIGPGEEIDIFFEFEGTIPQDYSKGGFGIFHKNGDHIILSGWYPILAVYDDEGWNLDPTTNIGDSVYSDIAYFDLRLEAAKEYEVISTGLVTDLKEKEQSYVYDISSGPSRDFTIALGKDFKSFNDHLGSTKISTYYLNGNMDKAKQTMDIAKKALETFNGLFGTYPFVELDIVEASMSVPIGVEFPQIIVNDSRVYGNKIFTSHEIAHQWWYNLVGSDVIDEPWLDEALTTYSSLLYLEYNEPKEYYQEVLDYFRSQYDISLSSGKDDIVSEGLDHFEDLGVEQYSNTVYIKGALFFNELRSEIGDDAFFISLKEYYQTYKYSIAEPEGLLSIFEKNSARDLDGLYDRWLYSKI